MIRCAKTAFSIAFITGLLVGTTCAYEQPDVPTSGTRIDSSTTYPIAVFSLLESGRGFKGDLDTSAVQAIEAHRARLEKIRRENAERRLQAYP